MRARNTALSISMLCGLFGYTRFAWYRRESRWKEKSDYNEVVLDMVRVIRVEQPKLGTPKLYYLLKPNLEAMGIKMGRNALNELIQQAKMGVKRRKRRIRTTDSSHGIRKYPNLIEAFEPDGPHQLWVVDITFLAYERRGFCFLTLITDAYSHRVIGYNLSKRMLAEDCVQALEMALGQLPAGHYPIHHTDRGSQFISELYTDILKGRQLKISMTQNSDPRENAIAERINGILKHELQLGLNQKNFRSATKEVHRAVRIYNTKRPHASCDFLTPEQAHSKTGILPKRWKNYRKEYAIRKKLEAQDQQDNAGGIRHPPAPPGRIVGYRDPNAKYKQNEDDTKTEV